MRALVTGLTGFVGGHLAEHLLESGDEVQGLSNSLQWPPGRDELAGRIQVTPYDLATARQDDLAGFLQESRPDAIYHLAAQSNPQASLAEPRPTWEANLLGTLTLLEALRVAGLKPRVVLVGSGVCYGNPPSEHLPVTEACPLRPNNPYAASKAAVDLLGIQHWLAHGTPTLMARPFNHAGPGQAALYALSSFARQIAEIEAGQRALIEVGNLDVVRDFTDVRDIVRAYRLLVLRGRPGEIYNIGSGRHIRLSEMLDRLRGFAHVPIEVRLDPARLRPVDQPLLLADSSKLRGDTGWVPALSIDQTLSDMLGWWRRHLTTT